MSAKVRYLKVAVAGELRNDVAWLRIPPGHFKVHLDFRSNEDAVKMILCSNVFKPMFQ